MFKYAAMFGGILIMCVPEDTSNLRLFLQGSAGLALFILGSWMFLEEK